MSSLSIMTVFRLWITRDNSGAEYNTSIILMYYFNLPMTSHVTTVGLAMGHDKAPKLPNVLVDRHLTQEVDET